MSSSGPPLLARPPPLGDQFGHPASVPTGSRLEHHSSLPGNLCPVSQPIVTSSCQPCSLRSKGSQDPWPQRRVWIQESLARVSPKQRAPTCDSFPLSWQLFKPKISRITGERHTSGNKHGGLGPEKAGSHSPLHSRSVPELWAYNTLACSGLHLSSSKRFLNIWSTYPSH